MARTFNTAGPCRPDWHYMVDPLARLPEAQELAEEGHYFVLHAPRQTGKTTLLRALAKELTGSGELAAVYACVETGEPAGDDYEVAQASVLYQLRDEAEYQLPAELQPPAWPEAAPLDRLSAALSAWAQACPLRLVLLIDEIDALRGESLRAVLRQLRSGFAKRPERFPWSIVLCGLRDVRDYKAASGGDPGRLGTSSPFNIKVESLKLGDFTRENMEALFDQHSEETGQPFAAEARERIWELSGGQPWLVNAIGREITKGLKVALAQPIDTTHADEAKERLVLKRQTHLDSLVARLEEPRVRRLLAPLMGDRDEPPPATYYEDAAFVHDLGLVHLRPLAFKNPIYKEVMTRAFLATADSPAGSGHDRAV